MIWQFIPVLLYLLLNRETKTNQLTAKKYEKDAYNNKQLTIFFQFVLRWYIVILFADIGRCYHDKNNRGLLRCHPTTYWRCPFTVIFHIKCAGCGITRGVHSLLEGNIIRSLQYNPLSLLITLAFSIFCLLLMIDLVCKKTLLFKTYTTLNNYIDKHRGPFIVMAILYWCVIMIYRNWNSAQVQFLTILDNYFRPFCGKGYGNVCKIR